MPSLSRTLAGLLLFAVSFGYLEAAVVIYIRAIYTPLQLELMAGKPHNDLFPLIDRTLLQARAPDAYRMMLMELGREAATMVMLAAVALLITRSRGAWLASFAVAMGAWDLSFYVFLKLLVGWPASLATWDVLFLLPVPWVGPVWSPAVVAIALVTCGAAALYRPVAFRALHWAAMAVGCALILASFWWNVREILAGELPVNFAWPLFAAGAALGVGTFLDAWRSSRVAHV